MLRKIFLTFLLLLVLLIFIIHQGWNLFKVNDGLKKVMVSKIQSIIGENCTIDKLSVGLGSVNLEGVQLVFRDAPYKIWIEELRLGYSIGSLLDGGITPEKIADEITVYNPKVTLLYDSNNASETDVNLSFEMPEDTEQFYQSIIKEYDFIKRITISEGEIVLFDSGKDKQTRIAKQINGWAYTDKKGHAWIRLAGHVFESDEYNMVMYGHLDLNKGGLDYINVDLHNYKIGDEIPFLLPSNFEVLSGLVNGHLRVTQPIEPGRGFNIEGTVLLKDGRFKLASENLYFEDINIDAEIKEWSLLIKEASQTINGSPTKLSGRIINLLHPRLDLQLASENFDVGEFLDKFQPNQKFPLKGLTRLHLSISGEPENLKIHGALQSNNLKFYDRELDNFQVQLDFENSSLNFGKIYGALNGATVTGGGRIDFSEAEKPIDLKLNLDGDFTKYLRNFGIKIFDNSIAGKAEFSLFGSLKNPVSTGNFNFLLSQESEDSVAINGSFNFSQGRAHLTAASLDDDFRMTAVIDSIFKKPFYNLEATNAEKVLLFIDDPRIAHVRKNYNLNIIVDGAEGQSTITVNGFRRDNYEKLFEVSTRWQSSAKKDLIDGEITLFPTAENSVDGEFSFEINDKETKLKKFQLGDVLKGSFDISKLEGGPRKGKFTLSGLKLSLLMAALGYDPSNYGGGLFGELIIGGDSDDTKYNGSLWLIDGLFKGMGPLNAKVFFNSNSNKLQITHLKIEDSGSLNITAGGTYDFNSKEVDAFIAGSHVDVNDVVTLASGSEDIVAGLAEIQVSLKGNFPRIPLYGTVNIHNGKILMFDFDEAVLNLGEKGTTSNSYFQKDMLQIQNVILEKSDEFSLEGTIQLPLKSGQNLDVRLSGDGNFLSMLSDLADLFTASESEGHLDLHLTGNYAKPNFTGSRLQVKNGTLELSSVVKKIENIQGHLVVSEEDYYLDILDLQGSIQGESFAISNRNELIGLNHGVYEPLRIAGDDLNLGAIILETSKKGIPLNIPGLMEKGDLGKYSFVGQNEHEQFFIAGPWQRPKIRGKIRIRNANLMFPFDESIGEQDPLVERILNNFDWDVIAVSAKNTRYVKQFPTAVYVNMELDKENSELVFTGVLRDSTFRIGGQVESTRGEIEYFDLNFRIEKIGAEFTQNSLYPLVYGKAWTVVRDSTNVPSDVYLTLSSLDETNQEVDRGRWDRVHIKLSSEFQGFEETQKDLMASLGYSSANIDEQATKAVGYSTDNLIFRPLMRPLERELERKLGLDVVRFSYSIAQNFLNSSFTNNALGSSLELLKSSRWMFGKYLTENLYLLYTGELKAGIDYQFQDKGVGLQHVVGLEYRLNPQWLLQMEYDYNTLLETHKDDKKVWLRHSFPF